MTCIHTPARPQQPSSQVSWQLQNRLTTTRIPIAAAAAALTSVLILPMLASILDGVTQPVWHSRSSSCNTSSNSQQQPAAAAAALSSTSSTLQYRQHQDAAANAAQVVAGDEAESAADAEAGGLSGMCMFRTTGAAALAAPAAFRPVTRVPWMHWCTPRPS